MTTPEPTPPTDPAPDAGTRRVHLYLLLDRSGSMAAMADDVIGGVNRLLAEQRAEGADALVTLVQFDSTDDHEVVVDAVPVAEVLPLDHRTFVPRGGTPLLDATALLLERAGGRAAERRRTGRPDEEVLVVSVTDGHENASTRFTLPGVRALVEARTQAGWTFVFLGAALDVYGEAGGLGYDRRSVQTFAADGTGAGMAFESLSHHTSKMRRKVRAAEVWDKGDFFEDGKSAEADRRQRYGN